MDVKKREKLTNQLNAIQLELMDAISSLNIADSEQQKEEAVEMISTSFVNLADLSETANLPILSDLAAWADENILAFETENDTEWAEGFVDCFDLLTACITETENTEHISLLVEILSSDHWKVPYESEQLEILKNSLTDQDIIDLVPNTNTVDFEQLIEALSDIQSLFMESTSQLNHTENLEEREALIEKISELFVHLSGLKEPALEHLAEWADENFAVLIDDQKNDSWQEQYSNLFDLLVSNAFETGNEELFNELQQLLLSKFWLVPIDSSVIDELMTLFSEKTDETDINLESESKEKIHTIPQSFIDKLEAIQMVFMDGSVQLDEASNESDKEAIFEEISSSFVDLAEFAEATDIPAFSQLAEWADENFALLEAEEEHDWLNNYVDWLDLFMANITEPNLDNLAMFEDVLTDDQWQSPIDKTLLNELKTILETVKLETNNEAESTNASDNQEIIHLTKPPEMDIRLWDAFLMETPDLALELSTILDAGFNQPKEKAHIAERKAHTIKGSCALVSIQPVASICEHLEGVFEYGIGKENIIDLDKLSHNIAVGLKDFAKALNQKQEMMQWNWQNDLNLLKNLTLNEEEAEIEHESESLSTDDTEHTHWVDIEMPADMDPRLIDAFFMETPDLVAELSEILCSDYTTLDKDKIQKAQRFAHTIKGSIGMLGLSELEDFVHRLEDLFEGLADTPVTENLSKIFIDSADAIEHAMDGMKEGEKQVNIDLASIISRINTQSDLLAEDSDKDVDKAEQFVSATVKTLTETNLTNTAETQNKPSSTDPSIRVETKKITNLMYLVGELTTAVAQLQGRLDGALKDMNHIRESSLRSSFHLNRLDTLVDVRGVPAISGNTNTLIASDFDSLEMDEYHELHSITNALRENMADDQAMANQMQEELHDLVALGRIHERLSKEINDAVLTTRMRPVSNLIPKLERIVREAARESGKKINFEIIGQDILADTNIIAGLNDPLLHILRNAIDHSIETPDQRMAKNKPVEGHVLLHFYREGNNIGVKIADDGEGFNIDKILDKAVSKGFEVSSSSTEADILRFILSSGFSTKDKVSKLSGRGVGMDVVRESIENLKGSILLRNGKKSGAEVLLRLPLTLVSLPVLLLREAGQSFAIPADDIKQIFYAEKDSIFVVAKGWIFHFGNQDYAVNSLSNILGLNSEKQDLTEYIGCPVLLIEHDQGTNAVLIDVALERRDVVVQPLGQWLDYVVGVSGSCILADGSVAPVLELKVLLQKDITPMPAPIFKASKPIESRSQKGEGIIVVDDSLSARRSLQIAVEQLNVPVRSAIDGLDAITKIEEGKPLLMLVDMEMPNMNGLELTTYIRANADIRDIIIVMVTSRSQKKHREQAKQAGVDHYLTKPFEINELQSLIKNLMLKAT